ncbi:ethanolamine utilization protein EutM [Alsobacter soli]|uniref:Ethanolamine utilization protein EutM n=2 Tax=Alsobacter soli TaxID=2109933 RepID=A0A2T1HTG2_9HYPH|nr:ethanolamine utilization protein EutM [Alsobacter soli]
MGTDASRRALLRGMGAGALALCAAGCNGTMPDLGLGASPEPAASADKAQAEPEPGKLRVALLLPLSAAGQTGVAAASLRNAAEMAVAEFPNSKVALLVKDDRGAADGGREAAQQALAEGAEVIVGPLFAPSVQAAGQVAGQAGKPVIAFSTDAAVAARGVYLLSFMPESEVDRIVGYAASRGKRSIAAMIPNTAYGTVVTAAFQEAAARYGVRVAALERYNQDKPSVEVAARRIAALGDQADALLLPDSGDGLALVAPALAAAGLGDAKLQLLGTGLWDEPRVFGSRVLQGGWYAAPDKAGFNNFAARYRARFGADPTRIATLAFDAVFLVNALSSKYGAQAFAEATFTNPEGVVGTDGLFRFRQDGTNQRGLAVLQVGAGSSSVISAAPRSFAAGM